MARPYQSWTERHEGAALKNKTYENENEMCSVCHYMFMPPSIWMTCPET